jgi:hypothetical protein
LSLSGTLSFTLITLSMAIRVEMDASALRIEFEMFAAAIAIGNPLASSRYLGQPLLAALRPTHWRPKHHRCAR